MKAGDAQEEGFRARGGGRLGWLLILLLLMPAACSPLRLAEGLLVGSHLVQTRDIPYGEEERQRLDVYSVREATGARPVVVFLYGGSWQDGSRNQYRLLGNALTRRGLNVVVPDYRLHPEAFFPDWVEDGARAVDWTLRNISRFGGDTAQIFVVGHSAGAHTAALLALDDRYLQRSGVRTDAVRGFVSIAGPVDTIWTDPDIQTLMGPREGWPATYPAQHVTGTGPPLLLLHGTGDRTVRSTNSSGLGGKILDRGGCARVILYPGVGHVEIIVAAMAPWLRIAPVLDDLFAFVQAPERFAGCTAPGESVGPEAPGA